MTKDCSFNYEFSTWKLQSSEHVVYINCFLFVLTFRTIHVHNTFSSCSELGIFMYWTRNSMNNLLSYCGLVDARISASEEDLPVYKIQNYADFVYQKLKLNKQSHATYYTVDLPTWGWHPNFLICHFWSTTASSHSGEDVLETQPLAQRKDWDWLRPD